jgi:hypothetical protein
VTDWGLPDWTQEKHYPAPPGEMCIWAWEFLRRWPEYREFWKVKIEPFIDGRGLICRDANGIWWPHLDELETRFGVYSPSPPQSTTPSRFTVSRVRWVQDDGEESQKICLREHKVAFIFDLSRPLNPQFEAARASAQREQEGRQKSGAINLKASRKRTEKYVLYLRILDAEAGASPKDICDLLLSDLPDDYPDFKRRKALSIIATPRKNCVMAAIGHCLLHSLCRK